MIEHDAVVQHSIQATCRACCAEHVATSPARPHPRAHHNACCLHVAVKLINLQDHRLVDAWGSHKEASPSTPGLLPNVSLAISRPVFIRVDLRPWSNRLAFRLDWTSSPDGTPAAIPPAALSPAVSPQQQQRRTLQERAATGWNQWVRSSNLAQVVLPQQVGVDLGILTISSGNE
jgi:hypothetical protein